MNNNEILNNINAWQSNTMLHLLTCGNDSKHTPLKGVEENGKVILLCIDCDYRQSNVPPTVTGQITSPLADNLGMTAGELTVFLRARDGVLHKLGDLKHKIDTFEPHPESKQDLSTMHHVSEQLDNILNCWYY